MTSFEVNPPPPRRPNPVLGGQSPQVPPQGFSGGAAPGAPPTGGPNVGANNAFQSAPPEGRRENRQAVGYPGGAPPTGGPNVQQGAGGPTPWGPQTPPNAPPGTQYGVRSAGPNAGGAGATPPPGTQYGVRSAGPTNHQGIPWDYLAGPNAGGAGATPPPGTQYGVRGSGQPPGDFANPQGQGQTFSPTSNLIGSQFTPGSRRRGDQGMIDNPILGQTAPPNRGPSFGAINPDGDARSRGASGMVDRAAQGVSDFEFSPFDRQQGPNTDASSGALGDARSTMAGMTRPEYQRVAGTDLSGARGTLGRANEFATAGSRDQAGPGQVGSFGYSGDSTGVRGQAVGQLNQMLQNTPDRGQLAANNLALMEERSNPGFQQALRSVGQKAAALGRVGAGLTTSELGDVATTRERTLDQSRRQLAGEAAGMSLQDQQAKLQAAQGLSSEMAGQDTAAGGLNRDYNQMALNERGNSFGRLQSLSQNSFRNLMDLSGREADYAGTDRQDAMQERGARSEAERGANDVRGRQADFGRGASQDLYGREDDSYRRGVGERDAAQDYESRTFGQRRSQFGDLSGYEGDVRGSQRSDRGELRGERGFQAGERDRQYGIDRDQIDDQRSDRREQRGERDWQYGLDQDDQREQRGRRDEFRGERDYQYGLERDSIRDRESQYDRERGARSDDFDRDMRMAEFGYGQNPSSAYGREGARQGQQAQDSLSGVGPMFGEWAQRRQRGRGGSSAPRRPPPQDVYQGLE